MLVRHRGERDGRVRDRIKAVLLRDDGMSYGEIARVLFLSDEGVRQQIEDYLRQNGKLQPENGGSEARLTDEQAKKLDNCTGSDLSVYCINIFFKGFFGVSYFEFCCKHRQTQYSTFISKPFVPGTASTWMHLDETIYTRTRDIVEYVKETFGVAYSVRGLTKWLKQHGFTYHKPVGVPAKADDGGKGFAAARRHR